MRSGVFNVSCPILLLVALGLPAGTAVLLGQEEGPPDSESQIQGPALSAPVQSATEEESPTAEPRKEETSESCKDPDEAPRAASEKDEEGESPKEQADEPSDAKEQPAAKEQSDVARPESPAEPEPLPPLSEEMTALGRRLRQAALRAYQLPIDTRTNTAWDVMEFCLAFGVDAQVRHGNQQINGLGSLCWNFPCGGYRPLIADEKSILARVGYGFQGYPGQLLAILGQSGVPSNYELRVDQRRGSVADLVEYEKRTCRSGTVQAHKLIGLACYVTDNQPWKNDRDEPWSVERLLGEEVDRDVAPDTSAVTHRLMGLSYAVARQQRRKAPIEGEYARAQRFLDKFSEYALAAQNPDGSWHPSFFAMRGGSRDAVGALYSTGHILEWLAYWIPDEQLSDPKIVRSVSYLAGAVETQAARWNAASTSPRDISALAHSIHALTLYDRRVFQPYDAQNQAAQGEKDGQKK